MQEIEIEKDAEIEFGSVDEFGVGIVVFEDETVDTEGLVFVEYGTVIWTDHGVVSEVEDMDYHEQVGRFGIEFLNVVVL